ncbi:MAG: glycosyltransferase involved in cell wall biosynthesis [Polaribacter sp.]|jgi:glycosyltransferase involved in cell wall biosynthesis
MKKIRVLHVVLSLGTGGLENGIINIINGSNKDEFHTDVICIREQGELHSRIQNSSTKVFFDTSLANGLIDSVKHIRQTIINERYDIVHTHGWATMLAGYLALKSMTFNKSKPIIINGEHGTLYFESKQQILMQRFLFKRMRLNLSVSVALVKEVARRFNVPTRLFKAVLNGVNVVKFSPNLEKRNIVRDELGIKDENILIGSVGRLVEVKNYPSLIRAFSLLLKRQPNTRLALAGDGPEKARLSVLIDELDLKDKVFLLGRREDVPSVMNAYDIFVLPSFREGLSNTILEAMSAALPAVVTNVGGSPEIVIENKTGHLFEVSNIIQLADLLESLIIDKGKLQIMSADAREHVVKNYSLETMVKNYQHTYRDLLNKKLSTGSL